MRNKPRPLVLLIAATLFILFPAANAKAQERKLLNFDDFTGVPAIGSKFTAYTTYNVFYRYTVDQTQSKLVFKVNMEFDNEKSWFRLDERPPGYLNKILNHEQGHYDIGFIMKNEVEKTLNGFRYTKNYRVEIDSLFKMVHAKYRALELKYDDETRHGLDAGGQKTWNSLLAEQIRK